jgi:hypothetical protein
MDGSMVSSDHCGKQAHTDLTLWRTQGIRRKEQGQDKQRGQPGPWF